MIELKSVKNLPDVWKVCTPTLSAIKREFGEQVLLDYISLWLIESTELLNVKQPLSDAQIIFAANYILNHYQFLTIADFKYLFEKAVTGGYGEIYHKIDAATVIEWVSKHVDERLKAAELESYTEHISKKERSEAKNNSREEYKKFLHKWKLNKMMK